MEFFFFLLFVFIHFAFDDFISQYVIDIIREDTETEILSKNVPGDYHDYYDGRYKFQYTI